MMIMRMPISKGARWWAALLLAGSAAAGAVEPGTDPVPSAVTRLKGCWSGQGKVLGKPVAIVMRGDPVAQDALFAVDVDSSAIADPADRYAAHLIFGGERRLEGGPADPMVGFWADSFGGAYVAMGHGAARPEGFEITYTYPDNAFINHWEIGTERLTWEIVARDKAGAEQPFASYALRKVTCPAAGHGR